METATRERAGESLRPPERHRVAGERLLEKIREIVHEGNVRRLIIRDGDDQILIEVPLGIGVVGALVAPAWAAIGAVAALVADCSIEVVRLHEREARSGGSSGLDA